MAETEVIPIDMPDSKRRDGMAMPKTTPVFVHTLHAQSSWKWS